MPTGSRCCKGQCRRRTGDRQPGFPRRREFIPNNYYVFMLGVPGTAPEKISHPGLPIDVCPGGQSAAGGFWVPFG
jgi:hypothetical protein